MIIVITKNVQTRILSPMEESIVIIETDSDDDLVDGKEIQMHEDGSCSSLITENVQTRILSPMGLLSRRTRRRLCLTELYERDCSVRCLGRGTVSIQTGNETTGVYIQYECFPFQPTYSY